MVQVNFTIHIKDKNPQCYSNWEAELWILLEVLKSLHLEHLGWSSSSALALWNRPDSLNPNRMEGSKPSGGTPKNNNVAEN